MTSYREGIRLVYQHLLAVSQLQQQYGRWCWRWRAPCQDRLALRLTPAGTTVGIVATPVTELTASTEQDRELVKTATEIVRDAKQRGVRLSQAALARQLRARGHSIANHRLRWLSSVVASG